MSGLGSAPLPGVSAQDHVRGPSTARLVSGIHSAVATICGAASSAARTSEDPKPSNARSRSARAVSSEIHRSEETSAIPIVNTSPARKIRP